MPLDHHQRPIIEAGESLSDGIDCSAGPDRQDHHAGQLDVARHSRFKRSDGIMYNEFSSRTALS